MLTIKKTLQFYRRINIKNLNLNNKKVQAHTAKVPQTYEDQAHISMDLTRYTMRIGHSVLFKQSYQKNTCLSQFNKQRKTKLKIFINTIKKS